jgi:hypothetical protein
MHSTRAVQRPGPQLTPSQVLGCVQIASHLGEFKLRISEKAEAILNHSRICYSLHENLLKIEIAFQSEAAV